MSTQLTSSGLDTQLFSLLLLWKRLRVVVFTAAHQYMQLYIDRCIPQGDRIVCVAICFNFCITPSHRHMDPEIFHLLFVEAVVTSVLYLLVLMVQLLLCFFVT